ncbi:MAG: protein kinase [Gemmatimonadaceae bacterium]
MDLGQQLESALSDTYTIERELSGGGMARVFVAVERALGRRCVIKVLPPDMAAEVSAERFKREISLAARLQHPHIVPLLSAGEINGTPYYTMPFVRGETLRRRLARDGELSVTEAIHVLHDVAAALAHAHTEGVVHRDIKPDNVIVSGGVAVVTDFGVAKALDTSRTENERTSGLTSLGVALGTPAYMSPEQASADVHVDHRADIYSFGCLAYELLTGTSPFANRPPQQMLAAHVSEAPEPLRKRRPNVPLALADLVGKCLQKRASDRPQSAEEILHALDAIATPSGGTAPTDARWSAVHRRRRALLYGAVIVAAAAAIGGYAMARQPPLVVAGNASRITSTPDIELDAAISPDGKLVAFAGGPVGEARIYVRHIGGGRTVLLSGGLDGDHRYPRWSPDGSSIVFQAKGGLYVVPALGGRLQLVAQGEGSALMTPAWSPDGSRLAYADERGLWVRALTGGTAVKLRAGNALHSPSWSPDGKRLAYVSGNQFYIASSVSTFANLAPSAVWIIGTDGSDARALTDSAHLQMSPVFTADGRSVLFVSNAGGTRDVYQLDLASSRHASSKPRRITVGLQPYSISLSADGTQMGYSVLLIRGNVWTAPITGDPTTTVAAARPVTASNSAIEAVHLSHDGKWIAYDSDQAGNQDIYKLALDGGEPVQLTTDRADDFLPRWSPNDREIAFHTLRHGSRDLYVMDSEGRNAQRVTAAASQDYIPDWSPDGRRLCFSSDLNGAYEVYTVTRDAAGKWSDLRRLTNERGLRRQASRWSPDGKHIAYVYAGRLMLVTPDGSSSRTLVDWSNGPDEIRASDWGPDGSTVFFHTAATGGRHAFWSVPATGGKPRLIARFDERRHVARRPDFATDGRRLFFVVTTDEADVWVMSLKR